VQGFPNVAAADGLLSQPSNQQTTNPSAQTRNIPVENPPESRVNGGEPVAASPPRDGDDPSAALTDDRLGATIDLRA